MLFKLLKIRIWTISPSCSIFDLACPRRMLQQHFHKYREFKNLSKGTALAFSLFLSFQIPSIYLYLIVRTQLDVNLKR